MKKIIGIYKITSPTGRIYIGQSVNIKKRWTYYRNLDCKGQPALYRSFLKHGLENHIFEILEECHIEELSIREHYYQELYDVIKKGLNCIVTDPSAKRAQVSLESHIKRSNSKKGALNPMSKRKGKLHFLYGKQLPKEWKESLSKNSGQAKPVVCSFTGIVYKSLTEACNTLGLNYGYMMNVMQGYRKNKTTLRWQKESTGVTNI